MARNRPRLFLVVALVVLAGCNAGPGDRTPEPIEADASAATVPDEAVSTAGFSRSSREEVAVNRSGTLSISGDVEMSIGYQIRATGWRTTYRSADGGMVFGLYTLPLTGPERVDAQIDPLGDRSLSEVVAVAQTAYSEPGDFERVQNRTVSILGAETTVEEFAATATRDGETVEVAVYVASVDREGDRIRAVAVTPRGADDWSKLSGLFESTAH
jgi:hypothetical protein